VRVRAHSAIRERHEDGYIGIGQDFGVAITFRHRKQGRRCVELLYVHDLRCGTSQRCPSWGAKRLGGIIVGNRTGSRYSICRNIQAKATMLQED
jgi:hypothetical protein